MDYLLIWLSKFSIGVACERASLGSSGKPFPLEYIVALLPIHLNFCCIVKVYHLQ